MMKSQTLRALLLSAALIFVPALIAVAQTPVAQTPDAPPVGAEAAPPASSAAPADGAMQAPVGSPAPSDAMPAASDTQQQPPAPVETGAVVAPDASATAPQAPAQDGLAKASKQIFLQALEKELAASAPNPTYVPPGVPSLFFSPSEYASLQEARSGFAIKKSEEAVLEELQSTEPSIRELSLQGILFRSDTDWTIWFNKQQLTPDRLPLEIIDLKVSKEFIELKWFDRQANQIVPIRLRPNQRFNLDARIFLPG